MILHHGSILGDRSCSIEHELTALLFSNDAKRRAHYALPYDLWDSSNRRRHTLKLRKGRVRGAYGLMLRLIALKYLGSAIDVG